ncbi:MAG: UvrB/UvrC motif-containing protein [Candidatus Omnitrophica bacterium]|nr:UvrB/UvrC motif-containing protein [Candidatus Omnitrophota bacterium]
MICDACKQQQATVHLTEIVNDQMTELHLCESCANQKGAQAESHFGLADLLAGLADVGKTAEVEEEVSAKSCPGCGMTYNDFRKVGRLGCDECYMTFKRNVVSLLKRIHGSTHHMGKAPTTRLAKPAQTKAELADMKRRLEQAIEMEEFEEAARLRDHIRELERQEQRAKKKSG